MTKLSTHQEAILARLSAADDKYREARAHAHARHRRLADAEIHDVRLARDIIAVEAHVAGVSKTAIAQIGLHTLAVKTARDAIENASALYVPEPEPEAESTATEPEGLAFAEDGETVLVTLRPADFAQYGIESESAESYGFRVDEAGDVHPDNQESDATYDDLVVRVVMADAEWRRRIVEFAGGAG